MAHQLFEDMYCFLNKYPEMILPLHNVSLLIKRDINTDDLRHVITLYYLQ